MNFQGDHPRSKHLLWQLSIRLFERIFAMEKSENKDLLIEIPIVEINKKPLRDILKKIFFC